MKKKELIKLKTLKATDAYRRVMEEDAGEQKIQYGSCYGGRKQSRKTVYKYYRFIKAEEENGILKVGIWLRTSLKVGQAFPDFTIYLDRENEDWITFEYESGRWLKGMIFNLPYASQEGEGWGIKHWSDNSTITTIAGYLGMTGTAYGMVKEYQTQIRGNELKKRHESELEQIDEFMDAVPEYPKGYNKDWIRKSAFKDKTSILYHTGKKVEEGYCTRCMKMVPLKIRPRHLEKGKCPVCRTEATFRSWGKQKYISESKNVGIIQKTANEDEYCLSVQEVRVTWYREDDYKEPEITECANYRFRLDRYFKVREEFEIAEYNNTGVVRWCHPKNRGMYYWYTRPTTFCVLYEKNLGKLRENTDLQYIPLEKLLRHFEGTQMEVDTVMSRAAQEKDECEKLLKVGLYNLTKNMCTRSYGPAEWMRRGMNKLEDTLKLDKDRMRMAVRMDITQKELEILQVAKNGNITLDEWQLRTLAKCYKNMPVNYIHFILKRGNLTKSLHYFEKIQEETGNDLSTIAHDYEDYMNQLAILHLPTDKSSRFPGDFYRVHEELSEMIRAQEDSFKAAADKKKNAMLKNQIRSIKALYEVESKDYVIIWPKSKNDFILEGQLQHNCVSGYFDKVATGKTTVFFLRKKEDRNTPFCTVEFTNGKLIQCRTIYNREAPEDVQKYMKKIEKHYQEEIEKEREAV